MQDLSDFIRAGGEFVSQNWNLISSSLAVAYLGGALYNFNAWAGGDLEIDDLVDGLSFLGRFAAWGWLDGIKAIPLVWTILSVGLQEVISWTLDDSR